MSVPLSVGTDLVETRRISRLMERYGEHFARRVYTLQEISDCEGHAPSLAARWAAKEAVAKALGTGIGKVGFTDIEVRRTTSGQPELVLYGEARRQAEAMGLRYWSVSLTHDAGLALAFVVGMQVPLR